jgi:hypothetical protein
LNLFVRVVSHLLAKFPLRSSPFYSAKSLYS